MGKLLTRIQPQRKVVKVFVCWWGEGGRCGDRKVVRNILNSEGDRTVYGLISL